MYCDMTKGNILKGLIIFALPMMAGNLLQQMYNIADYCRTGCRQKCPCGSRLIVYHYGVSHFRFSWTCHGCRSSVFNLLRQKGYQLIQKCDSSFICTDNADRTCNKYPDICVYRRYYEVSTGSI